MKVQIPFTRKTTPVSRVTTQVVLAKKLAPQAARAVAKTAKPATTWAAKRATKIASPPKAGWKVGPISVGRTKVIAEPAGNKRRRFVAAAASGALFAYLFDPTMGRSRRGQIALRTGGLVQRVGRALGRPGSSTATTDGSEQVPGLREQPNTYDDAIPLNKERSLIGGN